MNSRQSWDLLYQRDGRPWKGSCDEVIPMNGLVLELGIGNGKNLTAFAADTSFIGLDFSRPALLACASRHEIPLLQADIAALPFPDQTFPNVAASHVLGHLDSASLKKAALEIGRVLKDGGTLYVSVFGEEDMRFGRGEEVEERTFQRGNGVMTHYFLGNEIPELFPTFKMVRSWERRMEKRILGKVEIRQERRFLLLK
ncbi:MAG TPA: class I SAM-dependent methyltransferase [Methanomassiliicoccales archaeon]|nr:class I SAM-dependent methyltransferase [Methanomassiliicoccales archaeon]HPR97911.1 class I SAM-dependent methyltransferase [Methanomassiliicoccales archaeon]